MKKIVRTSNAPAPIGPYNQAVQFGELVFVSGQIALDAESGALIQGSIEEETHKVMQNLKAVLEAADSSLDNVIKSSIFVSDMGMFNRINSVYAEYFTGEHPARETVEVAGLPKGVNVEISVIAHR
jgi:2-iminobutanoate/2-iminopropanoate deaminase